MHCRGSHCMETSFCRHCPWQQRRCHQAQRSAWSDCQNRHATAAALQATASASSPRDGRHRALRGRQPGEAASAYALPTPVWCWGGGGQYPSVTRQHIDTGESGLSAATYKQIAILLPVPTAAPSCPSACSRVLACIVTPMSKRRLLSVGARCSALVSVRLAWGSWSASYCALQDRDQVRGRERRVRCCGALLPAWAASYCALQGEHAAGGGTRGGDGTISLHRRTSKRRQTALSTCGWSSRHVVSFLPALWPHPQTTHAPQPLHAPCQVQHDDC